MATGKALPKKVKQVSISYLKKKLDSVFSIYIRRRDKGVCFTCGNKKPWKFQQNGHYISRSCLALRWDERNCNCQCAACNIFKNGNMPEYAVRLMKKHGPNILLVLNKEKLKTVKMTRQEYLTKIAYYEQKNGNR